MISHQVSHAVLETDSLFFCKQYCFCPVITWAVNIHSIDGQFFLLDSNIWPVNCHFNVRIPYLSEPCSSYLSSSVFTAAIIYDWKCHADAVYLIHLVYTILWFVLTISHIRQCVFKDSNENMEEGLHGLFRDPGHPLVEAE